MCSDVFVRQLTEISKKTPQNNNLNEKNHFTYNILVNTIMVFMENSYTWSSSL